MSDNDKQTNHESWTGNMKNRRKRADRRNFTDRHARSAKCDRRCSPDRRLNNIVSEWVPINHVNIHPVTRVVFSKS